MTVADAIVVGGGPAGAAVAWQLATAGCRVVLFEREARAHHKVCGEFLGNDAAARLRALGIDPAALRAAPIDRVRLVAGRREAEAPLPFRAWGLSRYRLDECLLARAGDAGADIRRGHAIRRLEHAAGRWWANGVEAPALFLATGKHDLRDHGRPGVGRSDAVGFKMHFDVGDALADRLAGAVEILLYDGGYAGLQLVEDGIANLCLLVSRHRYAALGRRWDRVLASLTDAAPGFGGCLAGARPLIHRPPAIAGIPYGHVHEPRASDPPGLYRLGDQFAVIPSFTGDGMAIALHSARLAAEGFIAGADAQAYHRALRRDVRSRVRGAGLLSGAAEGPVGRNAVLAACRLAPPLMTWIAGRMRMSAEA